MEKEKSLIFKGSDKMFDKEYPHLEQYGQAILQNFWIPEHFNYDRDVTDFKINLSPKEQKAIKRTVLMISQIENKVKNMWSRIDMRLPHVTIANTGHIFAMNEVVHQNSYKMMLDKLGLRYDFDKLSKIPVVKGRVEYLSKYLEGVNSASDKEFTKSLILFTLLIENTALFSYFAIIASMNKYKNVFNNFSSIVSTTGREEVLHGQFGAELIKIIREENPEWFDKEMEEKIYRNARKALECEEEIIDWVFEEGEFDFLTKENIKHYLRERFNVSLEQIGYKPIFEVKEEEVEKLRFFERSVNTSIQFDFFNEKSGDYNQSSKVKEDDWDF